MRRAVLVLSLLPLVAPAGAQARRRDPRVVTPPKSALRHQEPDDLSRGGTRKGGLELALGSITAVVTGVLIGRGIWELVRAQRLADRCQAQLAEASQGAALDTDFDERCFDERRPGIGGRISGALSLTFAVPLGVGAGFLLAHGVKVHRDYRRFVQQRSASLLPWAGPTGAGLGLRMRF